MSKERLEEIKKYYTEMHESELESKIFLGSSDVYFLIKQAERVQELEEIKNDAIEQIDVAQRRNKRLENRVQELESDLHQINVLEGIIADRAEIINAKDREIEDVEKMYREVVNKYGEMFEHNEKLKNDIGTYKGVFAQNKRYRGAIEEALHLKQQKENNVFGYSYDELEEHEEKLLQEALESEE